MKQYRAVTPSAPSKGLKNHEGQPVVPFKGKTCGVSFENGEAQFNDLTTGLKRVGLTAEQAATSMVQDFGYEVFIVGDSGQETPFIPHQKKTTPTVAGASRSKASPAAGG